MSSALPGDPGAATASARKRELLDAAYGYVLGNGLADMSLRPLAAAIGSSPRVLLYLFGSKDGLIQAILARAREEELRYIEQLRASPGLAATGRDTWAWLAAPEHRALLALWVEGYARSLAAERLARPARPAAARTAAGGRGRRGSRADAPARGPARRAARPAGHRRYRPGHPGSRTAPARPPQRPRLAEHIAGRHSRLG
jgi:AcrR family transcriptional regulator